MSKVAITDPNLTESLSCLVLSSGRNRCLLDLPYEILFEIFRRILSKGKLIKISKLSTKLKNVAGDTRFWKNVYIEYKPPQRCRQKFPPSYKRFAFETLYSEPWPVDVIDLSYTKITPSVSLPTDQVTKVRKLNMTAITTDRVTVNAILAKYQCTELILTSDIDLKFHIMGIAPETFSKQTSLEVLTLYGISRRSIYSESHSERFDRWLAPVLSNCKNLKTLNLAYTKLPHSNMSGFVKQLPTSLVKLGLPWCTPAACYKEELFFSRLIKRTPNLRELQLCAKNVECPYLCHFEFLETLHVDECSSRYFSNLSKFSRSLTRLPALETVYLDIGGIFYSPVAAFSKLRATLEPLGIIAEIMEETEYSAYPKDTGSLWKVSEAM